jgi:hypothetical protein
MARTKTVTYWEKVLRSDREFGKVSFGRQVVFHKVSNLWFLHSVGKFLSTSNLNRVNSVFLLGLDLSYLTPVNLNNSARSQFSPLVPKVCASDLVPQYTDTLGVARDRLCRLHGKVFVDFLFKRLESLWLVRDTILFSLDSIFVVDATFDGERQVFGSLGFQVSH